MVILHVSFLVSSPTLLQQDVMSTSNVSASHNFVNVQNSRHMVSSQNSGVSRRDTTHPTPLTRRHSDLTTSRDSFLPAMSLSHMSTDDRRQNVGSTAASVTAADVSITVRCSVENFVVSVVNILSVNKNTLHALLPRRTTFVREMVYVHVIIICRLLLFVSC